MRQYKKAVCTVGDIKKRIDAEKLADSAYIWVWTNDEMLLVEDILTDMVCTPDGDTSDEVGLILNTTRG